MRVIPGEVKTAQLHAYLLGSIAPRPICFASTIDKDGNANLSPFSFFNVFGAKPPIVIFSPARRVRDNTVKHTLENIAETKEVVINMVNYGIVQQMNLSSCEYPKGTDEFVKAGFTALASDLVKPFRVKESPVQLECKLLQIIETGKEGGAGNLIICEVVCMHIDDNILDDAGRIDPNKIDLVARMGGDYYCRASGNAVFEVAKPNMSLGILGNSTSIPLIAAPLYDDRLMSILRTFSHDEAAKKDALHSYAKELLDSGNAEKAWEVLLAE
jgi:flavin reductase (DIM6/NTAB) family NADH-FMN oxidoreductase RutF